MNEIPFEDQLVDLVVITPTNNIQLNVMTRKEASEHIRGWWGARESVRKKEDGWEKTADWLKAGTFAMNIRRDPKDPAVEGNTLAWAAVGLEHILGMFTRERTTLEVQERLMKAQETIAAAMSKQTDVIDRETRSGDEWKGSEE